MSWSPLPLFDMTRRLAGVRRSSLPEVAARTWEIHPPEVATRRDAFCLPGQQERIRAWGFPTVCSAQDLVAGEVFHGPTRGHLLKDAWLIDGVLYCRGASCHLQPRSRHLPPRLRVDAELARGAVYRTVPGIKWFAHWLMDDCVLYPLAVAEGTPVSPAHALTQHMAGYESRLELAPSRLAAARIRELVVFDDHGLNRSKGARFAALRRKLRPSARPRRHPGVFVVRGDTGDRRLLANELEVAEHLRDRRGFRILDHTRADVAEIIETCAGAKTVVGVEGSQLIHGLLFLEPGGALLTLQPPDRFVTTWKPRVERHDQHFGFVVGATREGDFFIDKDEVERTLDLFPPLGDGPSD
ncbi:MAG: glycosyltransferase family 61 protein [Polyangiaceae bacterium]|nr:glycosyltransferase family 61 protein [Polyangiaceae bacterium]